MHRSPGEPPNGQAEETVLIVGREINFALQINKPEQVGDMRINVISSTAQNEHTNYAIVHRFYTTSIHILPCLYVNSMTSPVSADRMAASKTRMAS